MVSQRQTPRSGVTEQQESIIDILTLVQFWRRPQLIDESRFNYQIKVLDGRLRVWRMRGDRFADRRVLEGTNGCGGVVSWCGVDSRFSTLLACIQVRDNARVYRDDVLRNDVLPMFRANSRLQYVQYNKDPAHLYY